MVKSIIAYFTSFFSKGHERTLLAKKNIFYSLILKGGSILIGLLLVPLTISYVNPSKYGIWLTLSSIISWFSFFDIGLGHGLRNKISESNATDNFEDSRIFISTTYCILTIVSSVIFLVFWIINHFINWNTILNTKNISSDELKQVAILLFGIFCLQFVLQIINNVLTACHSLSKVSLLYVVGQVFVLLIIYILTKISTGSLLYLVLTIGGVPVLVQIVASFWLYNNDYKFMAPSIKLINLKYAKSLLSVGGYFFLIQVGGLFLYQTDNLIVTQIFGPKEVTTFNVVYKMFSIITMVFAIIMTPFWSSFTDSYAKGDINWIKHSLYNIEKLWIVMSVGAVVLFFASPFLFKLWLPNSSIYIPVSFTLAMVLYVIAFSWQTVHAVFLNGIGKIRLQLYLVVGSALINIPMAIFFGKRLGLAGITLSNTFLFLIMGLILFYQTRKILTGTAKGIFNK